MRQPSTCRLSTLQYSQSPVSFVIKCSRSIFPIPISSFLIYDRLRNFEFCVSEIHSFEAMDSGRVYSGSEIMALLDNSNHSLWLPASSPSFHGTLSLSLCVFYSIVSCVLLSVLSSFYDCSLSTLQISNFEAF